MITSNGKYFLYRHIRLDTDQPFYIGVGTKRAKVNSNRISAYGRAFTPVHRNKYWHNIVAQSDYEVDIMLESDNKEFILEKEKEFVKLYGRKDLETGTLVNVVDGGSKPTNKAKASIAQTIETKTRKGNLGNAKNFIAWKNSPNYKIPRARQIYLYSIDGKFIREFNSAESCRQFIGVKGSASHVISQCNKKQVYKNKYVFSWEYKGEVIDLSGFKLDSGYFKTVQKICPNTGKVLIEFEKLKDAAESMNTDVRNISCAIHRGHKSLGFKWKLKEY